MNLDFSDLERFKKCHQFSIFIMEDEDFVLWKFNFDYIFVIFIEDLLI